MLIAPRVWLWAAIIRPLKHVLPLPSLVKLASPRLRRSAGHGEGRESATRRLAEYLSRRRRFPGRPPGNCLDRSLAVYRVLCRLGAEPRLVVGVRARETGVEGHVWILLDGQPFAEAGDIDSYARVVVFDSRGRRETSTGSAADLRGVRWA